MLRYLQMLLFSMFLAVFAGQGSAMFVQPDWLDPTEPEVGTNRYSYSHNDLTCPPLVHRVLFGFWDQ